MLGRRLIGLSNLGNKKNIVSIFLIANTLVWYSAVLSVMPSDSILLWAPLHFSALIVSAFAGASYGKQMERSKFLTLWMITGVISSIMLFGLGSTSAVAVSLVALFSGLSLGFGMPACMSYFTDNVPIESRGRASGIALLASGIGIVAFGLAAGNNLFLTGLILGVWRLLSLLVFWGAGDYRRVERKEIVHTYKQVFGRHSFVLYFMPWVMFSLVDHLAAPKSPSGEYLLVQAVFMAGAAVLGGFFLDSIGRKPVAIAGFAMLGLGTAVISFLGVSPIVVFFNAMIDGVAYGFLFVLFILTLWGDLSNNSSSDKYYALGVMPFFVSQLLGLTLGPAISEVISTTMRFSFAAVFLFLAVLPLFYARETLPEKIMKERQLKIYVEKAQEIAQKYY